MPKASEVRRRVNELVTAITRYRQLHGLNVDLRVARSVEDLQARIILELKERGVVKELSSASEALRRLLERERSLLLEFYRAASELTGDPEVPGDFDDVLASALSGDVEKPGARAILLVVQAVARAVAEERLNSGEPESDLSVYCPVCGAASETMYKRKGVFYMVCHFCGYTWRITGSDLLVCPACGATAPIDVGVVADKHKRLGMAACQRCGFRWRVILDEHLRAPLIVLPLIAMGAERYRPALEEALGGNSNGVPPEGEG